MATPQERKDKLVWEALEAPGAGPKQSLQLINRRIKKGEKYDYLLALKAHVLTMLPPTEGATSPSAEALSICTQLATRDKLPSPHETLLLLEKCFTALGSRQEIGKLYERVYQAKVNTPGRTGGADEDGLKEWLRACVRAGDWTGAQKAAMSLQKRFPNKREFYFWAVTACLSLHNSLRQENSLFGTLAYRMIVKAAEDASSDEKKPPRAIKTSQELHLLLDTLSSLKKSDESIKWLTSEHLGYKSELANGEQWNFWCRLADEYRKCGRWSDLWALCNDALEKEPDSAENETDGSNDDPKIVMGKVDWREDWKVWECLIDSAADDKERLSQTLDIINKHATKPRPHRSILLAEVAFAAANMTKESSQVDNAPTLLDASRKYCSHMSSKLCCYDDLRLYVGQLDAGASDELLKVLKEESKKVTESSETEEDNSKERISSIITEVNKLKVEYLLKLSKGSDSNENVGTFLTSCFETYANALPLGKDLMSTDNQYGDDALILAVQTVLHIYSKDTQRKPQLLVKCIILLEHLLQKSKRNYSALLLLVRVYMLLGAPSLALIAYQRLAVKQIQNDTLAHHVLSRISTMLPFSSPTAPVAIPSEDNPDVGMHTPENPTDSVELLKIALKIYNAGDRQMPRMITSAIDNGNYGQVTNFLEFGRRLEMSGCKRLFEVERRRVRRFRGLNDSVGANWDDALRIEMEDNRDWKIIGEGDWEANTRIRPDISPIWIKAFVLADAILLSLSSWSQAVIADTPTQTASKANSKQQQPQKQEPVLFPDLVSQLEEILKLEKDHFTRQERKSLEITLKFGQIEAETRQSKSGAKVKTLLTDTINEMKKKEGESVENGLERLSLADGPSDELWMRIHLSFSLLDTCKNAITLHDFLLNSAAAKALKPPLSKPLLASFKQEVQSLAKYVQKHGLDRSKAAREVTEADIDAVMISKIDGSPTDPTSSSVNLYIKEKIGRQKVEEIMDKIGKSQAEAWAAVGKVKI